MSAHRPSSEENVPEIKSVAVLGARITWIILGPMVLGLVTIGIAQSGGGWLTVLDALFAAVVAWIILSRWFEQRKGPVMLTTGERATPEHFRRYVSVFLGVALAGWIAANVLGNHVLA